MDGWSSIVMATIMGMVREPSVRHCNTTAGGVFVDCRNRGLEGVPYDVFDQSYAKIQLGDNPYACDCSMVWFMRELDKKKKKTIGDLKNMKCSSPENLAGRRIVDLSEKEVCSEGLVSKSRCNEIRDEYEDVLVCSVAKLKYIPFDVFDTPLLEIYLSGTYNCDCNIVWYMRRLKEEKLNKRIMDEGYVMCDKPEKLRYQIVSYLKEKQVCPQKAANMCKTNPRPCNLTTSTCHSYKASYKCVDINECLRKTHKCQAGEECVNKVGGYTCKCKPGHVKADSGTGCVVFINPCTKKSNPCNETVQTCVPGKTSNSYICEDIDECSLKKDNCDEHAECINTSPGYQCRCESGFKEYNNGRYCKDVNECAGNAKCSEKAKCVNGIGTYSCFCNNGYYGDGKFCKDVDECTGKASCAAKAKCTNTQGSYQCVCNGGYHGNGKVCADINECSRKKICPTNAKCLNTAGSYRCACKAGYSWDGKHCLDIDECTTNTHTCDKNALCINSLGGYKCRCKEGFEHFSKGRLCVKEEYSWASNTNAIVIVAAATCLLAVSVAFAVFFIRRKRKMKRTSSINNAGDENEDTILLMEQQKNVHQQLFVFNDCFADLPVKGMPKIVTNASTITEWSEDEDDFEKEEDDDDNKI